MIQKIIDAINEILFVKYPECTFYIQDIPKDFERPSFFIELINNGSSSVNRKLTEEVNSMQITYFAPVNDFYISDMYNKLKVNTEVKDIFRKGYITIDSRAIKVSEITGGPRDNELYLSMSFEYVDDRPMDIDNSSLAGELIINNGGA